MSEIYWIGVTWRWMIRTFFRPCFWRTWIQLFHTDQIDIFVDFCNKKCIHVCVCFFFSSIFFSQWVLKRMSSSQTEPIFCLPSLMVEFVMVLSFSFSVTLIIRTILSQCSNSIMFKIKFEFRKNPFEPFNRLFLYSITSRHHLFTTYVWRLLKTHIYCHTNRYYRLHAHHKWNTMS